MISHDSSELSDDLTSNTLLTYSDARIEQTIRNVVRAAFRAGEADLLTYRRIRTATEKKLGISKGSFKEDSKWSAKSKSIADDAMSEEQAASSQSSGTENPSKDSNSTLSQNKSAKRKMNNDASTEKASKKVKSKSTKRNEDVGTSGPMSTSPEVTSKKSSIVNGRNVNDGNADKNDNEHDPMDDDKPDGAEDVTNEDKVAADSSSELSELIDEAPPTKRKKSRKSATEVKAGKDAITKSKSGKAIKSKRDADLSPQEAEIKRLQSWLVKCGIRKVWGKELAPYDTPRTKIQHLKEMLADAGMEGRYSAEKASRIREQRELKADLDAVQEGAKMWGQTEDLDERDSSSGGDRKANRGRRLARGLRHLDFLGSDDGEETD